MAGCICRTGPACTPGGWSRNSCGSALRQVCALRPKTRVSQIEDQGDHITCLAGIRTVRAAHLVMATDGYTDGASKWMRRRVVSLASVVTATEAMDPAAVRALYPRVDGL